VTRARGLVVAIAVAGPALGGGARAAPDLHVHAIPGPRHLHMRRAAAAPPPVTPAPDAPTAPAPAPAHDDAVPAPLLVRIPRRDDAAATPAAATSTVHFRADLGFGIDGANPSGTPTLAGHELAANTDYAPSRGYGFGDLYLGSHGLVLPSLSTYMAAHAMFLQQVGAAPLPTAYDHADNIQIRSAWAESDGIFDSKLFAPIRLRAGRQYIYGPAPAHLDGFLLGYETRVLRLHLFGGTRVPDWDLSNGSRDEITGGDARLDLAAWKRFPAVIDYSHYHWGDHEHDEVGAAVTRGQGLYLRGSVRTLDGRLAHEHVSAHFRVSDVTRVIAEIDHRSSYDWRWDPERIGPDPPGAPRRYLELGQVGPRAIVSLRAGTVLLDNVDLLARGAAAIDQTRSDVVDSSYAATWGEVGAAFEVRVRRTLAFGASALVRSYRRPHEDPLLTGLPSATTGAALPASPATGEQSFVEGGMSVRYSSGARKLSATGEIYARRLKWHRLYDIYEAVPADPENPLTPPSADIRGGGRVSLDAWVTPRFRLRAEYELSSTLDLAPEILGYKSLRIMAEGSL
jgi:hypothetical protein